MNNTKSKNKSKDKSKYKQITTYRSLVYYLHKGKVLMDGRFVKGYYLDNEKKLWCICEEGKTFRSGCDNISQVWKANINLGFKFGVMV